MCRVVHLLYGCGHMSPRTWLIYQHPWNQCPGLVYETGHQVTRQHCPPCRDILRPRDIRPETDAGRRMSLGYQDDDWNYVDPRLNHNNYIITLTPPTDEQSDSDPEDSESWPRRTPTTVVQPPTRSRNIAEANNTSALFAAGRRNPGQADNDYGEFIRYVPDDENIERTWYGNRQGDQGRYLHPNDARPQANSRRTAANPNFVPPTLNRTTTGLVPPQNSRRQSEDSTDPETVGDRFSDDLEDLSGDEEDNPAAEIRRDLEAMTMLAMTRLRELSEVPIALRNERWHQHHASFQDTQERIVDFLLRLPVTERDIYRTNMDAFVDANSE